MAKHTKGPWRFEAPFTILGMDERSCGEMPIATLHSFVGTEGRAANAALIVAAPEMLAVLRWMLALIDGREEMPRPDDEIAKAMREVIAKAEGR